VYGVLDYVFAVFHGTLVLFNLTGWIWRPTRRIHLIVISLTFLSWFGLGVRYGWGYCPCTDWHWQVKRALGETLLPHSYVKYYADRLTGSDWDPMTVDAGVLTLGLLVLVLSVWTNWRDLRKARSGGAPPPGLLKGRT
jgi:Protein of Unknown function (DUF2784)